MVLLCSQTSDPCEDPTELSESKSWISNIVIGRGRRAAIVVTFSFFLADLAKIADCSDYRDYCSYRGHSMTTYTYFWPILTPYLPNVDISNPEHVQKRHFLDHLPTSFCPRSHWTSSSRNKGKTRKGTRQCVLTINSSLPSYPARFMYLMGKCGWKFQYRLAVILLFLS